jgi:progressive ankylosis protein
VLKNIMNTSPQQKQEITSGRSLLALLTQFIPLSLSDVAMTLGDPLQTSALSRLAFPQETLAGVGVVKGVAVFLESPIIMILHTSTALGGQAKSRRALWQFTIIAGLVLSGIFLLLTWEPLYNWLLLDVFGVSSFIAQRGRTAFLLMFLWPFVIAWRRFFQGLLIRAQKSIAVGWASVARLTWVIVSLVVGVNLRLDGAMLAGITMMGAILIEAVLVTWFCLRLGAISILEQQGYSETKKLPQTLSGVSFYYLPLASTMLIVWGARAILLSLIARSFDGSLALAVWPATWGLLLSIANGTRMIQQVVISAYEETSRRTLVAFVIIVGLSFTLIPFLLGFTDQGLFLLGQFLGNNSSLVEASRPVIKILSCFPLLLALQNTFQGLLIHKGKNWLINLATLVAATLTLVICGSLIFTGHSGATSAAYGMLAGVMSEIIVLFLALQSKSSAQL